MKNFVLAFLLSISLIPVSHSKSESIATVVKMRGSATKLLPGTAIATIIAEGDELSQDTSVVTGTKSFIQIKFIDNSVMSIGPESKIVISEMTKNSPGIISLLKGRIRTEVEKNNSSEAHKFFIRTRSAAMGVRGTDFQTIYNPDNHVTSLLTYKGEVAMAKLDESTHKRLEISEKNTTVTRDADTKAPVVTTVPEKALSEKEEILKVLDTEKTVFVLPGQNSVASEALPKATLPVKISPVQLTLLYKNRELVEKNPLNIKESAPDTVLKQTLIQASQKAPAEGFYDPKTGDFAPKSGGFIDQTTGLYIAPEASATFDAKSGVYVAKSSGTFDADTGQYVAPKGLVIDSKKGFILDKNAEVKPELLALREDMNRSIAREKVVGNIESEQIIAVKSVDEKFIRNRLTIALSKGSEKLKLNEKGDGGRNPFNFESSDMFKFSALWQINSTNRFAPILGLSYTSVDFDHLAQNGNSQDSKALISMVAGLKYALTSRIDLVFKTSLDQAHHVSQTSQNPDFYQLKRIVITNLNFGGNVEVIRSNRFSLMAEAFGHIGLRKRFNNLVVSSISGWDLKLTPQYAIDERRVVGVSFFTESESSKITGGAAFNQEKRTNTGAELSVTFDL